MYTENTMTAMPQPAQTQNVPCPQQGAYWRQQAETYYRYAQGYAAQLNYLFKQLGARDTDHALEIIAILNKGTIISQPAKQPQVLKTEHQELLDVLDAQTEQEAIDNLLAVQQLTQEGLANIFTSIAGAINSLSLKQLVEKNKAEGLYTFDDSDVITALNQAQYNAIFGLKKKYFDTLQILNNFVNPQLMQLNTIIKAKQRDATHQSILSLIPDASIQMPTRFQGSVKELIDAVQKLELE
jgi:hypothetical protein